MSYKISIIKALVLCFFAFSNINTSALADEVKHIILFIGDGMHLEHEIATSRYLTGKDFELVWNKFPKHNFVSTWDINTYNRYASLNKCLPKFSYENFDPKIGYDPDKGGYNPYPLQTNINDEYFLNPLKEVGSEGKAKVPATDSAAAATAMATGIKTERGNIAWLPGDPEDGQIKTLTEILREKKGFSIGVITTVPFNHATPAAFVSHNTSRNNYTNKSDKIYKKTITEEIITCSKPDIIIGGGHPKFKSMFSKKYLSKKDYKLIKNSNDYVFVERTKKQKGNIILSNGVNKAICFNKKLFGLFGGKKGDFESPVPKNSKGNPLIKRATLENPSLAEAVMSSLRFLSKDKDGFFLLAEQGNIDWANHKSDYKSMIGNVWDLNEAVKAALEYVNLPEDNITLDNTLIIVTSDHANSYTRLNNKKKLEKGQLPMQLKFFAHSFYPGDRFSYKLKNHTNELVNLYAIGNGINYFDLYEGMWYPNSKIIDNTHIFKVITDALKLKEKTAL